MFNYLCQQKACLGTNSTYIISWCQQKVENTRILFIHVFLMKLQLLFIYHPLQMQKLYNDQIKFSSRVKPRATKIIKHRAGLHANQEHMVNIQPDNWQIFCSNRNSVESRARLYYSHRSVKMSIIPSIIANSFMDSQEIYTTYFKPNNFSVPPTGKFQKNKKLITKAFSFIITFGFSVIFSLPSFLIIKQMRERN